MSSTVPGLGVRVSQDGAAGVVCLHLSGELDIGTGPTLAGAFDGVLAESPQRVVVDVGDLAFVDVRGLDVLLAAQRRLAAQGGALVLRRPSALVRRVLRLLDLDARLPVEA